MPSTGRRSIARALAAAALVAAWAPVPLSAAQVPKQPPHPRKLWRGSALANASIFFGNTSQQVLGADGKLARVDSALAVGAELQTLYGEASLNGGPRTVTKRSWMGTVTANAQPLAPVSTFVTTTYESSLEKRIAARYSFGAGAKWNVVRRHDTDASLSLSLSAERIRAQDSTVHVPDERLGRWSWLAKLHHAFDDRVDISHSTSWQPSANGAAQFLVSTNTQLRYKMNGTVGLSMSFTDNYDSAALTRGARAYNDGQMLFGVTAGW